MLKLEIRFQCSFVLDYVDFRWYLENFSTLPFHKIRLVQACIGSKTYIRLYRIIASYSILCSSKVGVIKMLLSVSYQNEIREKSFRSAFPSSHLGSKVGSYQKSFWLNSNRTIEELIFFLHDVEKNWVKNILFWLAYVQRKLVSPKKHVQKAFGLKVAKYIPSTGFL